MRVYRGASVCDQCLWLAGAPAAFQPVVADKLTSAAAEEPKASQTLDMSSSVDGFPYTSLSKKSFLHSMTRRWISTGNAPSRKALARSSSVDFCCSTPWICSVFTFGRSDLSHPDVSLSQPWSRQNKHRLPPHSGQAVAILTELGRLWPSSLSCLLSSSPHSFHNFVTDQKLNYEFSLVLFH